MVVVHEKLEEPASFVILALLVGVVGEVVHGFQFFLCVASHIGQRCPFHQALLGQFLDPEKVVLAQGIQDVGRRFHVEASLISGL